MALHSSPEPSSGAMNGNAHPQRQPAPPLPYFPAQLESPHSPSRPVLPPPSPLAPVLVRSSGLLAPPPPTPFWYPFSLSEQRPGAALEPHDGHDKMELCGALESHDGANEGQACAKGQKRQVEGRLGRAEQRCLAVGLVLGRGAESHQGGEDVDDGGAQNSTAQSGHQAKVFHDAPAGGGKEGRG
eukprot:scaffold16160_cov141-Isochrysis_galbana.AAC.1